MNFKTYSEKGFRIDTIFDNQNGVAAFAVVGFSFPLYLVLFYKKRARFFYIVPFLTSTLVGVTTGSRTFFVIFVLIFILFLYSKTRKHKMLFIVVLFAFTLIMAIVISLPFMETIRNRLLESIKTIFGVSTKVDYSTLQRSTWLDYAFELGEKNLLTGYGANGFSIVSGVGTYSHSNFSEVLCNFGLIGFVLFYLPLFLCVFQSFYNKKQGRFFVVTFFLYYFIVSFTNVIYYKKFYYLILAFMYYLSFIDADGESMRVPLLQSLSKIIFTCDTMGPGGAERTIATLANEFSKKGIEVTIIGVADSTNSNSYYHLDNNVKYIKAGSRGRFGVRFITRTVKLRKYIKKEMPDIIISFLPNANIYTCFALAGTSIPYIVSERNNPYVNPKKKIIRILKKYSFKHADGVVFQTKDAMNYYSKKIKKNSTIIPNPINLNYIPEEMVTNREKVVVAVGRLTEQKNYSLMLEAFKTINAKMNYGYELHIYGDGPLRDILDFKSKELGINDKVKFMGTCVDWHSLEYKASLFIMTSDYEGMPNALIEAIALGIPSLSTDCPIGGPKELLHDEFLVPVNDVHALVDKMEKILTNKISYGIDVESFRKRYSSANISRIWIKYIKGLTKDNNE